MIKKIYAWFRKPNKSTFEQYLETFLIIIPVAFVIRTFFYGLYQVPTGSMEVTMLVGERFFADKFTVLFSPPKHGDIITFNDPNFDYSDNKFRRLYQRYVWGPSNWTKRVIGIPGDHLRGVIEEGRPVIYRNGEKIDEPYVNPYPLLSSFKDGTVRSPRSWDKNASYENQPFYKMNPLDVMKAARILRQYDVDPVKNPYEPVINEEGKNVDVYDVKLGPDEYWALGDNRRGSFDSRFWGPLKSEHIHGKILLRLFSIDSNDPWLIFDLMQNPIEFWSRVRWSRFLQRVR